MLKHGRGIRIFFALLLISGIAIYFISKSSAIIGKGEDSDGLITQIIALIVAIAGLIGTVTTSYIAIRKERREQQSHEKKIKHKSKKD